jgi:outer membrane protein assembly factor BamB
VPSDDGKVYRVPSDAAGAVEMVCNTRAAVKGIALNDLGDPMAASVSGAFFAYQGGACSNSQVYSGEVSYLPVASGASFYGAEGSSLHSLIVNANGLLEETWSSPANLATPAAVPLAIASSGQVIAATSPAGVGSLLSISPAGTPTPLATTDVPSDGPVVLANGDLVVPERGKTLSSWSATGAFRWRSAALPGVPLTPLVLAGGADQLLVADARGNLTALDAAGQLRWTTQLAPAAIPLRPPNLVALPGGAHSLGYFPAANGRLYAVILDGRLDGAAPWPKAFHDPRNTGNAATALPTP